MHDTSKPQYTSQMKQTGSRTPRKAVMVTEPALALLASSPPKLSAAAASVLWHLVSTLPPAGDYVSLTAVAVELGLSRVQVTRSTHSLLELGCLIRGPKDGSVYLYKLNAAYFYPL